ncbi:general substrate transporter [Aspergillus caelatus]|uniref:General substrate transporter n=1 Tax=Aspergillus caelatus TaxID=61420 RepID=A0A5N6ZVC7_9EURO|nr:general substrate transporter [Aspergillus caelatus]KAE8361472.1 general substrate transporter [Aspergillus caelatus]
MTLWSNHDGYVSYFRPETEIQQTTIAESASIAAFFGAIIAGHLSDHFGRRAQLMIAAVVWTIGSALQCSAQSIAHLIVGRVVGGLAAGMTSQGTVYLAELAPRDIRGRIVGFQQWTISLGIFATYLIAYACTYHTWGFRLSWGLQGIPGLILLVSLLFFPESPRWLAVQGRWTECEETLAALYGHGGYSSQTASEEISRLKETVDITRDAKQTHFFDLFRRCHLRHTVCGISVQMGQRLLGPDIAMYYIPSWLMMAGQAGDTSLIATSITSSLYLFFIGATLIIVDLVNRRYLLIAGAAICMGAQYALAGVMASHGSVASLLPSCVWVVPGSNARVLISLACVFTAIYSMTWAPLSWIYCAEIFPLRQRAKGVALSTAMNEIVKIILGFTMDVGFENLQWGMYVLFGVFGTMLVGLVYFLFPDTRRRALEDILFAYR